MLIYKVLNNNAVVSKDEQGREIIVTGKGIAFRKAMYDELDPESILTIYVPKDRKEKNKLEAMISEIPYEYFAVAEKIREMGEKELNVSLDDGLSIRLADHIHYSVEKIQKKIFTPNLMLSEIQHFYKKEYEIGLKAIEYINHQFETIFDEHEAGFIAFHIVSSEDELGLANVNEVLERLQAIVSLIEEYFQVTLDSDSSDYFRLVTHLKFFINKMFTKENYNEQALAGDSLYDMLVEKYENINVFLDRLSAMTLLNYDYELSDTDRMYLIIHLARLIK